MQSSDHIENMRACGAVLVMSILMASLLLSSTAIIALKMSGALDWGWPVALAPAVLMFALLFWYGKSKKL